ncbi:MAG: transposase [Leptospirales bacterium]
MKYDKGFKKRTVRRMLKPDGGSVSEISKDTGIATPTLYNWLKKLKEEADMSEALL